MDIYLTFNLTPIIRKSLSLYGLTFKFIETLTHKKRAPGKPEALLLEKSCQLFKTALVEHVTNTKLRTPGVVNVNILSE